MSKAQRILEVDGKIEAEWLPEGQQRTPKTLALKKNRVEVKQSVNNTQKTVLQQVAEAIQVLNDNGGYSGMRRPLGKVTLPNGNTTYVQVEVIGNQWDQEYLLDTFDITEEDLLDLNLTELKEGL